MKKSIQDFGVGYEEVTLVDGVKLHSFYKQNSPIYFRAYFYAGSQFDDDKSGLAHFCEHMIVGGTEKYPTKTILNEKIQEIGARSNAFTNKQNLWISIDLADKSDMLDMFEKVDQILNHSIFSQDIIEKERGAILAEQTRNTSNPAQYINVLQGSVLFQGTKIENPVLGFDESVKKINREDLVEYREKYITNGYVAYFIAGDFDINLVVDSLNKINGLRKPIKLDGVELPIINTKKQVIKNIINPEQNYLSLSTRLKSSVDKLDRVVGSLVSAILGQGNTSRLNKSLRYDKGLVYGVQANIFDYSEFSSLIISTSCKVRDSIDVIKVINDELRNLIDNGINKEEMEISKKNIIRNIKFESEISSFWVSPQMMKELTDQQDFILPDEYLEILKSLSVEDVNMFIKKYFEGKELLFAGIGDFEFLVN
jgi:predicted Zn-dependent peptidase